MRRESNFPTIKPLRKATGSIAGIVLASMVIAASAAEAPHPSVRIVELPGASVPDAEAGSAGAIHVAYLDDRNIYYVRSDDGGERFSQPVRVNDEAGYAAGGLFRGPDLTLGQDGRIHISWYNNAFRLKRPKSDRGLMYSRMRDDRSGFEPARNLSKGPSDGFSLAANGHGRIAAMWINEGLFMAESTDQGATFGAPARLPADPCECCGTRSMYRGNGLLFYLYRDKRNNNRDMFLGRSGEPADHGFPVRLNQSSWNINACPLSGNFLTGHAGGLLAAWETRGGIYFSGLDDRGNIWPAGEIKVTDDGRYPVIIRNDTAILVAWKKGRMLSWQLFDMNGSAQGTRQSVPTSLGGRRPAGVVTADGQFLLFP